MASTVYNIAKTRFAQGLLTWKASGGTTMKAALVTSSYTVDADHNNMDSVASYVIGTRMAVVPADPTQDDANNKAALKASNITFSSVATGSTAKGIVIHEYNADDTLAYLVAYIEFSPTIATNDGDIQVVFDSTNGVLSFS